VEPKTVLNSEHVYVWYSSLHVTWRRFSRIFTKALLF